MTMPNILPLDAHLSVTGQIDAQAVADLAAAGFRSIINNRPDFEGGPGQPSADAIERAARAAGLAYAHLPVSPAVQTPDEIARFKQLVDSMPQPILAFCRTGTRSGKLYQAAFGGAG